MATQQYVRFDHETFPWEGAWPPPDRMATLSLMGMTIGFTTDAGVEGFDDDSVLSVTWWTRGDTSALPDDAVQEGAHLARGAKYHREDSSQ